MIGQVQKNNISERLLKSLMKSGIMPSVVAFAQQLNKKLQNLVLGSPFFKPRMAIPTQAVNPSDITENFTEIKADIDVATIDVAQLIGESLSYSQSFENKTSNLTARLNSLSEGLTSMMMKLNAGAGDVLFDNFRDMTKIDTTQTTAYIDTTDGYATLPSSSSQSVLFDASNVTIYGQSSSVGSSVISGNFLNLFLPSPTAVWQVTTGASGYWQTIVNLTNSVPSTDLSNTVEINKITATALSPLNMTVEGSLDGLNWTLLGSQAIASSYSFDIPSVYVLMLRFTMSPIASKTMGLRSLSIEKVGSLESASIYSLGLAASQPIYDMNFTVDETVPTGCSINHFIGFSSNGPWTSVTPGPVQITETYTTTLSITSSGSFLADYPGMANTLYSYPVTGNPVINSGQLTQGLNQFEVSAFGYDWSIQNDPRHIPVIEDWGLGYNAFSCYMGADNVGSDAAPIPFGPGGSLMLQYVNPTQVYMGVAVATPASGMLVSNYNYKFTTYFYSDRDILVSNATGGMYSVGTSGAPLGNAIGWTLYVNGNRIVSDSTLYYVASTPGSGVITDGDNFSYTLLSGWNRIDILIYMPGGITVTNPIALLLSPNLFNYSLSDSWQYSPGLLSYPIQAKQASLSRVSEFYLQWNVAPNDHSYWAWRIDPVLGNPTDILLNYNPYSSVVTIDGLNSGDVPALTLQYVSAQDNTSTLYYRADMSRDPSVSVAPKLRSYQFTVQA